MVSIHAPVRGRRDAVDPARQIWRFNPRPREGATLVQLRLAADVSVSIHAPVRGRRLPVTARATSALFQSTPP